MGCIDAALGDFALRRVFLRRKTMDKLVFAVICFILSVLLFSGKGSRLIEGKKDSSEREHGEYNITAISKTMGFVLLAAGVCFIAIYFVGVFLPKFYTASQSIFGLVLALLGIVSIVFINKSPRFREK